MGDARRRRMLHGPIKPEPRKFNCVMCGEKSPAQVCSQECADRQNRIGAYTAGRSKLPLAVLLAVAAGGKNAP